jgi:hypothetical protein
MCQRHDVIASVPEWGYGNRDHIDLVIEIAAETALTTAEPMVRRLPAGGGSLERTRL